MLGCEPWWKATKRLASTLAPPQVSIRARIAYEVSHLPNDGAMRYFVFTVMHQHIHQISIATRGRGLYEVTDQVAGLLHESKLGTGLATVFIEHTSASLLIQENADPEVRRDLDRFFDRLVRDGDPIFRHTEEGEDDMPSHVRSALTQVSLGIPFSNGRLVLGTWQGIYVWEHRKRPHNRRITIHLLGEINHVNHPSR